MGSNRTFMELKYRMLELKGVVKRSNRTFMELKCLSTRSLKFCASF